jgi:hypothetical protein
MIKLSSSTVGRIMLGKEFHHFTSIDQPLHKIPLAIAEALALNKKIASRGEWYHHLPFGDPKRLKDIQQYMEQQIEESITEAKRNGAEDLPLQDAALKAANVIGELIISSSLRIVCLGAIDQHTHAIRARRVREDCVGAQRRLSR